MTETEVAAADLLNPEGLFYRVVPPRETTEPDMPVPSGCKTGRGRMNTPPPPRELMPW